MCIRFRTCEMRHLNQVKLVIKDQALFKTKLIRRCVFALGFAAELILLSWYCGILNLWQYIIQIYNNYNYGKTEIKVIDSRKNDSSKLTKNSKIAKKLANVKSALI